MRQESMSLLEFQERFCDEEACISHLYRLRWPKGFACPRCGHKRFSFVVARRLYQCSACRYQTSVTAGTVFHKTRTPIRKWFWMIFMMTRQKSGVSILRMQKLLKIGSYRTAWSMGHKIREAMSDLDCDYKLAGMVEIGDEFLGRNNAESRAKPIKGKSKIVIGIERSGEKAGLRFIGQVERLDSGSVPGSAKGVAESGRVQVSGGRADEHAPETVGVPPTCEIPDSSEPGLRKLTWAHTIIANIKGNIRGVHHGVSIKHFQKYLSEYCYRFNRRRWESQLFNWAVTDCLHKCAVTISELKA